MTHVVERLAQAIADRIAADVPAFEGRAYINGAAGWDRKSYPMCLVAIGRVVIDTARTGTGARRSRMQTRAVETIVEIAASSAKSDGAAHELRATLAAIVADVEVALAGFEDVPVEDLELVRDSGLTDVGTRDERFLRGQQALTFAATIHTVEGRPDVFAEELF